MREIEWTSKFKKEYHKFKRNIKGLDEVLFPIIEKLACDIPLEIKHRDHLLTGDWKGYRNCHIKPDLILIYKKSEQDILILTRLTSHSELGF